MLPRKKIAVQTRRPTVLFLNSCVSGGGAGRSLLNYLKHAYADIDAHIVMPEPAIMGEKFSDFGQTWIVPEFIERIHRSPYRLPKWMDARWIHLIVNLYCMAVATRKIIQLCAQLRPDVIYCNHMLSKPIGAFVGWYLDIPVIFHARNISMTKIGKKFYTSLSKLHCVKKVVSNSIATAEDFTLTVEKKVQVIHNFVDTATFDYDHRRFELRERYRVPEGATVAAFFGRLVEKKGVDVLIDASIQLFESSPNLYIFVIGGNDGGDIDYLQRYREKVAASGYADRIIFTGMKDDIRSYLADVDFVVMPSTDPEPFGRILVEAMAYKIPAIATDHGGASEVVRHRRTGLLVPPKDVQALADAMKWFYENPDRTRAFGEVAYQRLSEHFSAEHLSTKITEAIVESSNTEKN